MPDEAEVDLTMEQISSRVKLFETVEDGKIDYMQVTTVEFNYCLAKFSVLASNPLLHDTTAGVMTKICSLMDGCAQMIVSSKLVDEEALIIATKFPSAMSTISPAAYKGLWKSLAEAFDHYLTLKVETDKMVAAKKPDYIATGAMVKKLRESLGCLGMVAEDSPDSDHWRKYCGDKLVKLLRDGAEVVENGITEYVKLVVRGEVTGEVSAKMEELITGVKSLPTAARTIVLGIGLKTRLSSAPAITAWKDVNCKAELLLELRGLDMQVLQGVWPEAISTRDALQA
jgi:hypothetical protein